jgi:hypothetical protein
MFGDAVDPSTWAMVGSAIVWAGVIVACTILLGKAIGPVIPILGGGVVAHVVLLGGLKRQHGNVDA